MGSSRSGRYLWRVKMPVESCLVLNGYKALAGLQNRFESASKALMGMNPLNLDYQMPDGLNIRYSLRLTFTAQPRGGRRFWFLCPAVGCGRRVAKLYLPPDGKYFACRHCYHLTYRSCQESHRYDSLFKFWARYGRVSFKAAKEFVKADSPALQRIPPKEAVINFLNAE